MDFFSHRPGDVCFREEAQEGWTRLFVMNVCEKTGIAEVQFLEPKNYWHPNATGLIKPEELLRYKKGERFMQAHLLVIDGRHLLWRTSDAFSDLFVELNGKEVPTGGVYGFLSVLLRVHQRFGGKVIIAWEGVRNFRRDLYPEYKKRDEPDEEKLQLIKEMAEQEKRIKAVLRAIGVRQYYGINCEADDVIGRLSTFGKGETDVVIYSGDSDLRQLVNDNVFVCAPGFRGKEVLYDSEKVFDKHGVEPVQIADLKALAGDSSDNIPGVKSIGDKTAVKLLTAYGNVEQVVRASKAKGFWGEATWPVAERFQKLIEEHADDVLLFKELTTIKRDAPMKAIKPKRDQKTVLKHFRAYKFRSLTAPAELRGLMKMAEG